MNEINLSIEHICNNFARVEFDGIEVWFSYATPIAFRIPGQKTIVRENEWGKTTGKHINMVSTDKSLRVDGDTFAKLYNESKNVQS